jgi:hypothetical protein
MYPSFFLKPSTHLLAEEEGDRLIESYGGTGGQLVKVHEERLHILGVRAVLPCTACFFFVIGWVGSRELKSDHSGLEAGVCMVRE